MNPKKVISKHKFQRLFLKKDTWFCHAHYLTNTKGNPLESEMAITAILNGNFLYIQKLSKTEVGDYGFPKVEYYRYNVTEGSPRADRIAYYKLFEVF